MTVFKDYPYWPAETLDDIKQQMREIANVRKDDITQISNLVNIFVGGRSVGKIPVSSADITADDKIGDVSRDTINTYIVQDDGLGGAHWIKYAGSTF